MEETYSNKNISATETLKVGGGKLGGIFVSAASATPTITVYDGTSASGTRTLISVFTPVAATMYTLPNANFSNGLHVVISGTVSATVFWV